ncbi:TPA: hypothetical protein DEF17_08430 [bacterium]|nr:hypothetical protein [bacterium]
MDTSLLELQAFTGLNLSSRTEFIEKGKISSHKRGTVFLYEGKRAENFFVLLSGTLSILRKGKVVGRIERGGSFGRLSLITGAPSLISVTVRHDSKILAVPGFIFQRAFISQTEFSSFILKDISNRLNEIASAPEVFPKTVTSIYSCADGAGKTILALSLAESLKRETKDEILLINVAVERKRFDEQLGFLKPLPLIDMKDAELHLDTLLTAIQRHESGFYVMRISHDSAIKSDADSIAPLLSALSQRFKRIIIDLPSLNNTVVTKFLQNSDLCLMLLKPLSNEIKGTAKTLREIPIASKIIITRCASMNAEKISEIESQLETSAAEVLEEFSEIRSESYNRSVSRIARLIADKLKGVALSSGAARGLAHIGAIRFFEEIDFVPDYISGTSMGALIATLWAMGSSANLLSEIAKGLRNSELFPIRDISIPPSPGLVRGKRAEKYLNELFGNKTFFDLFIPIRIIAADIDSGAMKIFDRGKLFDAVRASISIPGLFPPYVIGKNRYIDGAVVDPIPVSALRNLGVSKIVAVNAVPPSISDTNFSPTEINNSKISFWKKLIGYTDFFVPEILDVVINAIQFMESRLAEDSARGADVVIRPFVSELKWSDFDKAERFIEEGYRTAKIRKDLLKN